MVPESFLTLHNYRNNEYNVTLKMHVSLSIKHNYENYLQFSFIYYFFMGRELTRPSQRNRHV